MIFEIHDEGKIAYKRLTPADIKRSSTSHQTHIGLSDDILTYMPDEKRAYTGMLIYDTYCDILRCEISKIHRKSGKKDATNIKSGGRGQNNIVRQIRAFAKDKPKSDFYLVWFGLDSLTPVFWLIEEKSFDFISLSQYCDLKNLKEKTIVTLSRNDFVFAKVLELAQKKVENVSLDLRKDLELSVEIEKVNPKFKDSDIQKAKSYIYEIGRTGEHIIDNYLGRQKSEGKLLTYDWVNRYKEKGDPYDFYIKYIDGSEQWIDVKATPYEFERAAIISKNEINFITEKSPQDYSIFRVYSISDLYAKLKICSDCLKYMAKLQRDIDYITQSMKDYKASITNYKIAFEPSQISFNIISDEIRIDR